MLGATVDRFLSGAFGCRADLRSSAMEREVEACSGGLLGGWWLASCSIGLGSVSPFSLPCGRRSRVALRSYSFTSVFTSHSSEASDPFWYAASPFSSSIGTLCTYIALEPEEAWLLLPFSCSSMCRLLSGFVLRIDWRWTSSKVDCMKPTVSSDSDSTL